VRVLIADGSLQIRLSRWQKALGLLGDIAVPLADVKSATVVAEPVREAMAAGIKVGLRVPYLYFIARTIALDEAFVVRRGVPALAVDIENEGNLRRVLVSTPDAGALAQRLAPAHRPTPS
jgi:hypothetical protein